MDVTKDNRHKTKRRQDHSQDHKSRDSHKSHKSQKRRQSAKERKKETKRSKKRKEYERKANALRVDISSISKDLFEKEKDKGTIGGQLTKKALDHLEYYIEGQLRSDKKNSKLNKSDLQDEIFRIGSLLITSAKGYS